jgi:hypothetical protein
VTLLEASTARSPQLDGESMLRIINPPLGLVSERLGRSRTVMHGGMAFAAQRDQVLLRIVARMAAKLLVVNLKIGHRAARLAFPAIPAEHLGAKLLV